MRNSALLLVGTTLVACLPQPDSNEPGKVSRVSLKVNADIENTYEGLGIDPLIYAKQRQMGTQTETRIVLSWDKSDIDNTYQNQLLVAFTSETPVPGDYLEDDPTLDRVIISLDRNGTSYTSTKCTDTFIPPLEINVEQLDDIGGRIIGYYDGKVCSLDNFGNLKEELFVTGFFDAKHVSND